MLLRLKSLQLSFTTLSALCLLFLNTNAKNTDIQDRNQVVCNYNDLKLRNQIPIYFGTEFNSKTPNFLSKEKSNSIPFSSQKLPFLLEFFNFSPESPQAKAIQQTLKFCENRDPSDSSLCVTSMESMLEFIQKGFIHNINNNIIPKVFSTSKLPIGSKSLQKYTIVKNPEKIPSSKVIECHLLTYPYAVFSCYDFPNPEVNNQVFRVSLRGEDGGFVDAIVNCHMNTSSWNPNDGALVVLGLKPGGSPVCQFLPSTDLLWVPVSVDLEEGFDHHGSV